MNRLQPGNRLLLYLVGVFLILGVVQWVSLVFLFPFLLGALILQKRIRGLLHSLMLILPFLFTAALLGLFRENGGLLLSLFLSSKLLLIALWNHYLFYCFGESELLSGMNQLRMPPLLTVVIFFIFRYYRLIRTEVERLKTARKLRGGLGGGLFNLRSYRTAGEVIGAGLLRSLDRGDRVYQAMQLRGLKAKVLIQNTDCRGVEWSGLFLPVLLTSLFLILDRGVL